MFLILTYIYIFRFSYKSYKYLKRFCWIKYIFWLLLINNSKQNIGSYVIYPSIEISSFSLPLQSFSIQWNNSIEQDFARNSGWILKYFMPDSSFGRGSIESDHLEYLWGTILVTGEQISIEIDSDNIVDTSSGFIPGTVGQWNFYDGRIPSRRGNYCCQFFSSIFSFCISLNSNSNVSNKFFFLLITFLCELKFDLLTKIVIHFPCIFHGKIKIESLFQ